MEKSVVEVPSDIWEVLPYVSINNSDGSEAYLKALEWIKRHQKVYIGILYGTIDVAVVESKGYYSLNKGDENEYILAVIGDLKDNYTVSVFPSTYLQTDNYDDSNLKVYFTEDEMNLLETGGYKNLFKNADRITY